MLWGGKSTGFMSRFSMQTAQTAPFFTCFSYVLWLNCANAHAARKKMKWQGLTWFSVSERAYIILLPRLSEMLPGSEKRVIFCRRGVEQKVLLWFHFHRSAATPEVIKIKKINKGKWHWRWICWDHIWMWIIQPITERTEDLGRKWWLWCFQG